MEIFTLKASECLAKNLKELREGKKWSLSELAEKAGLSKQSIWNYENEVRFPDKDAIASLSRVLNIEETDFFNPNLKHRK